jgi:hypothetical protein
LIWDHIQHVAALGGGYPNLFIDAEAILTPQSPVIQNQSNDVWLHLVSNGLVNETMSFSYGVDIPKSHLGILKEFSANLSTAGGNIEGALRVNCNPFASLIIFIASDLQPDEIADEQALELFQTFMELPLGLQLAVFERMFPLLSSVSAAAVEDYIVQSEREKRLFKADNTPDVPERALTDADALGALAKELRDTGFERQSSLAAFEAYLSDRRFFDALAVLNGVGEASPEKVSPLASRLMIELAENADTITFLEMIFGSQEVARANLSADAVGAVMSRMLSEGFAEQVYEQYMNYPQHHSSIDLRLQAARALLFMREPEEALEILGDVSTEGGLDVRAQALAMVNDYAQASVVLRNNAPQDDQLRLNWLGGSLGDLVGAESKYAPIARILTAEPEGDEAGVTVSSAEMQLETSMSIRKELSELILDN